MSKRIEREEGGSMVFRVLGPSEKIRKDDWITSSYNDIGFGWVSGLIRDCEVGMRADASRHDFRVGRPIKHLCGLPS